MKKKVLAVFDIAVSAFMDPFHVPTLEAGLRAFRHAVNNPESPLHRDPGDFELWCLGEFDPATGDFTEEKVKLGWARQFVESDIDFVDLRENLEAPVEA